MYYPQSYHHIQEIQKYNIQDYRPRYVSELVFLGFADLFLAWNNSRKPSEKYDKYSACVNSADMLSRKQMNHKREYYKPTIPPKSVADMERWSARGRVGDDEIRRDRNCMMFGYGILMYVFKSSGALEFGKTFKLG